MADNFKAHQRGLGSPGDRHRPIMPSDSLPISPRPRALWCQMAGDVVIEDIDGVQLTYAVQAGQVLPFRAVKVLATGTTATVYGWD
ncbi:spike base protein, RCAP_Rcc01079 family [Rubellimicrobium aerolatum]|uniref:Uncharacterized protein n=1 Tax=Rubellimicrobium aerolatum TaxID=490979 RepID=A0ABW0SEU5_9RHOB|nr:hypothetical protein [Rubellimicrobium aerolatum]MBP1806449.1 hypothetical protein [Rubellimicrobium aerolatum]